MRKLLLLAVCLLLTGTTASAQSYLQKAYNYLFGSCPSYSGVDFDINKRSGDGLNATYFNGTSFDHEVLSRIDPEIYFYYSGTSPSVEVNIHQFSAVWTGHVYAPVSSEYTFTANVDDGIRLWLNDNELFNEWHSQTASSYSKSVRLEGGQAYKLRIEYYQANNDSRMELYWTYDGQKKRVIPQEYLFTNIDEEPLVLLGPSFMSSSAQKKYKPSSPNRPSNEDLNGVMAAAKTTNTNTYFTNTNIPAKPKSSSSSSSSSSNDNGNNNRLIASKKTSTTSNAARTRNKVNSASRIPMKAEVATPKTTKKEAETVIASNLTEKTELKELSSNKVGNAGLTPTSNTTISLSGRGLSKNSSASNSESGSLLTKAIDKNTYKPNLKSKPRRSGPIILKNILFDKDRYRLKPSSYDELNVLVDTLQKNQSLQVIIAGHTDFAGDPIPNQKLSESRAKAVAVYLTRHGIDFKRIRTKGYGGTKPLSRAPLGTEERRKNKRVEYILIEEGAKP